MRLELKDIQKVEMAILREVDRICKKNDIRYYLAYGTLLGAVRHNGFIPWDSDVDIHIRWDDYQRFYDAFRHDASHNFNCFEPGVSEGYGQLFVRIGAYGIPDTTVHLDVFPLISTSEKGWVRIYQLSVNRILRLVYFIVTAPSDLVVTKWKKFVFLTLRILLKGVNSKRVFRYSYKHFDKCHGKSNGLFMLNACGGYGRREIMESKHFEETTYLRFCSELLPVPAGYDALLRQFYGDYRQIPGADEIGKAEAFSVDISSASLTRILADRVLDERKPI